MSTTRAKKSPPEKQKIAFVGSRGDRTSPAARAVKHFFGQEVDDTKGNWEMVPMRKFEHVRNALKAQKVDYGVVAGADHRRLAAKAGSHRIRIVQEVELPRNGRRERCSKLSLQRVAFLGEHKTLGTFGALAARAFFKQEIDSADSVYYFQSMTDHTEVLEALWNRDVDYGVVAIENGVDGVVNETARGVARLTARGIHVMEEIALPVVFYLAAKKALKLTEDITIFAHPTAKGQCQKLKRHLKALTRRKVTFVPGINSNGAAARRAAEAKKTENCAAIVSWEGLMDYRNLGILDLKVKAEHLHEDAEEDKLNIRKLGVMRPTKQKRRREKENLSRESSEEFVVNDYSKSTTRFWKLGHGQFTAPTDYREKEVRPGKFQKLKYNRTSILLNLDHDSPGGLSVALEHFSRRGCNLAIVYPIPIPGRPFEYSFLLEFEDSVVRGKVEAGGHIDHEDGKLRAAYEELLDSGISLNPPIIFGAYPASLLLGPRSRISSYPTENVATPAR